jgi:hypothetical protein
VSNIKPNSNNIFGGGVANAVENSNSATTQKASLLPLVFTIVLIFLSLCLTFLNYGKSADLIFYILGYVATPLAVGLCMGWDSIDQRKKTKNNPWFIAKPKYSIILRILTAASFMVAFPHIHSIAKILSEYLAEFLGRA